MSDYHCRFFFFIIAGVLLFSAGACQAGEDEVLGQASCEILVQFKPQVDAFRRSAVLSWCGARQVRAAYREKFFVIAAPEAQRREVLRRLAALPEVAFVEPNGIVRACSIPDDPLYPRQWHFSMIGLEDAWQYSTGEGVVVAVLDTGINPHGRDGFGKRVLEGYNAILHTPLLWEDSNGHGTHVAGTIAQETGNGRGVAGIAPGALLLPVKVLGRFGYGTRASVAEGIYWAVDHGATIINMSLGEPDRSEIIGEAVAYAAIRGVTMVAAAGNDSAADGIAPVYYPAAFEQVIAVAAVDLLGNRAWYSNAGPEIDIVAPGGDIRFDRDADGYFDGILQETFETALGFPWGAVGWRYAYLQGTSMAAAHVTGVAALIQAIHRDWGPDDITQALGATARDLGNPGIDVQYGRGLVDAAGAVRYEP